MRNEKAGTTPDNWKENYDWRKAFEYAGPVVVSEYSSRDGSPDVKAVGECDTSPFTPEDVVKVYAMSEGENDGPSWIMWGKLEDGRYFFLIAGCDYTGWDCQAGGSAFVSKQKGRLVDSAMGADDRQRFGILSSNDGSK